MKTRRILGLLLAVAGTTACNGYENRCVDFGQSLTPDAKPVTVQALVENPATFAGRPLVVEGRVTKVCSMAGCWLELGDTANSGFAPTVRVTVAEGRMVFPLSSRGKLATVEGTLVAEELTAAAATPSSSGARAPELDVRAARVCG